MRILLETWYHGKERGTGEGETGARDIIEPQCLGLACGLDTGREDYGEKSRMEVII